MARVKLSEYRAKSILVDGYVGYSLSYETIESDLASVPDGAYVLKVDQGIKKRGKQGLVAVNITPAQVAEYAHEWQKRGFTRYIMEPLFAHEQSDEHYFSCERTRDGLVMHYSEYGGIDIEDNAESVQRYTVHELDKLAEMSSLPKAFYDAIIEKMNENHMSFLEINPLVVLDGKPTLLDAAVLVDSAGEYFVDSWSEADTVEAGTKTEAEKRVKAMDDNSPAALKLTVLHPDASLWLLLSGGGASITIADTVQAAGFGNELGNYGEYSGGPTTAETYLYTKEILSLALASQAPKKAIVIAGGVANFTDVAATFKGIIQALSEVADSLRAQNTRVFVRRGGPNEKEGLSRMETFLRENELYGAVYGSGTLLTQAASDAIAFIGGENV